MNKKAIALLSGGLDSILAIRLMREQGVEIEAVYFHIDFASCGGSGNNSAQKAAKMLSVPFRVVDITSEYLGMFKDPKHGYGANINPCIDCKIFMLKKAKEMMRDLCASFLVTGEVLGERPMSQRRDALNIIERDAGVKGILLRPLSAKLLNPTLPEKEGVVDRERLLEISGRSRKPQMDLAEKFGIKEYPNPAGGCLLTDPGFTRRVRDLISHDELTLDNLKLIQFGRYLRLSDGAKLLIGRDERENRLLESIAKPNDIILKLKNYQGPISVLRGSSNPETINNAAALAAYHTKYRNESVLRVDFWGQNRACPQTVSVKPSCQDEIEKFRI